MKTNQSGNIPKKKSWKKFVIIILSIVVVSVLLWAGLTKAGYISNFLDIEILFSEGYIPDDPYSDFVGNQWMLRY